MKRLYKFCYCLIYPFITALYWHSTWGRENIPQGAAILCGNHSSNVDPILMAFAMTKRVQVHFMAKEELFRIPVLGFILKNCGIFPVARSKSDVNAIKTAMKYLKSGEKVGMFPEGRRVLGARAGDAKTGAVRIAVKTGVPIVPVYLPRDKRPFSKVPMVIGAPYHPDASADYGGLADELMRKIDELRIQVLKAEKI